MENVQEVKHVLGLSGGKDSSALAIYMRDNYPELEIEYFFFCSIFQIVPHIVTSLPVP